MQVAVVVVVVVVIIIIIIIIIIIKTSRIGPFDPFHLQSHSCSLQGFFGLPIVLLPCGL